jgi:hypothetical protein
MSRRNLQWKGLDVVAHNVYTFKGQSNAILNGVSKTPTMIIGNCRIEGDLTADLLNSKSQSCLNE